MYLLRILMCLFSRPSLAINAMQCYVSIGAFNKFSYRTESILTKPSYTNLIYTYHILVQLS